MDVLKNKWVWTLALMLVSIVTMLAVKHNHTTKEAEVREAARQDELAIVQRRTLKEEARKQALAAIHFQADPKDELQVMSVGELTGRIYNQRYPVILKPGDKVKILTVLEDQNIYRDTLEFSTSPQKFLFQNYNFVGFSDEDLQSMQPGDEVEFIGTFEYDTDNSVSGHYVSSTMHFMGGEIHRVPHE